LPPFLPTSAFPATSPSLSTAPRLPSPAHPRGRGSKPTPGDRREPRDRAPGKRCGGRGPRPPGAPRAPPPPPPPPHPPPRPRPPPPPPAPPPPPPPPRVPPPDPRAAAPVDPRAPPPPAAPPAPAGDGSEEFAPR